MTQAVVLDGHALAGRILRHLAAEVAGMEQKPTLATVLVGGDAGSRADIERKREAAEEVGIRLRHVALPATASQGRVEDAVAELAADADGVFVQLPLPDGLRNEPIMDLIPFAKDVDGLSSTSLGRLVQGRAGHVPATAQGAVRLLEHHGIATAGRTAVIVGRSPLFGLPMALLLARRGVDATVTVVHSQTVGLADITREADILVSAAGVPGLITGKHVKPGAAVIDAGATRTPAGVRGDVAYDDVRAVAGAVTPMPGGTGPMTVACLLENTVAAARGLLA